MTEEIIKCCGEVVEWKFLWEGRDGKWYEKTCGICGEKYGLKCELSEEALATLEAGKE